MNGVQMVTTLILVLFLTSTVLTKSNQESQTKKGLGISACTYYGFTNDSQLPIDKLPKECTSFLWDGLLADENNNVNYRYTNENGGLDQLLKSGKPVYVYFYHQNMKLWAKVFGCGGRDQETKTRAVMKSLQAYMKPHPGIKGLIVGGFEPDEDSTEYPGFTKNLINYIKIMRETFPHLEIAIFLQGKDVVNYDINPKMKWLDLKLLNTSVDIFGVSVYKLNKCSLDSRVNSVAPVIGCSNYTMTRISKCLKKNSIPKEKLYYSISLVPMSTDPKISYWYSTYQQICIHPDEASGYCVDNTLSFFHKGQFVKANAAGFFGSNVDLVDPNNVCGCGRPFAPFYAVLDGFNGKAAPNKCSILDKL